MLTIRQTPLIILHNLLKPQVHKHHKAQPYANTVRSSSFFVPRPESSKGISSAYTQSTTGICCLFAFWCHNFPGLSGFSPMLCLQWELGEFPSSLFFSQSSSEWPMKKVHRREVLPAAEGLLEVKQKGGGWAISLSGQDTGNICTYCTLTWHVVYPETHIYIVCRTVKYSL